MMTVENLVVGGEISRLELKNNQPWQDQDQQSGVTEQQAQVLLESSGSPERAIQAIESLSDRAKSPPQTPEITTALPNSGVTGLDHTRAEQFARECGYQTLEELIQTSEVLLIDGQITWYLLPLGENDWRVWNTESFTTEQVFTSRQEALQAYNVSDLEAS